MNTPSLLLLKELLKPDPEVYALALQIGLFPDGPVLYQDVRCCLFRETPIEIPNYLAEALSLPPDKPIDDFVHHDLLNQTAIGMGAELFTRGEADAIEEWTHTAAQQDYQDWGVSAENTFHRCRQEFPMQLKKELIAHAPFKWGESGFSRLSVDERIADSRILLYYVIAGCGVYGELSISVDDGLSTPIVTRR